MKSVRPLSSLSLAALLLSSNIASAGHIVATAREAGGFGQLLNAARAAGLEPVLSGKGPVTLFAPSDAAFGRLPQGALFKLLQPESKALLAALLKAHVVAGDYPAARLRNAKANEYTIPAAGGPLTISKAGGLKAGGATVVNADMKADNGVIHMIDAVIIPPKVAAALAKAKSGRK